jgi:hypothetical protein
VAKELLAGDHVGAWWTRHHVPGMVGQQGRVFLFHSATPMWVDEGGAKGGGDRGCVRRSDSRISCQDQPVDGAANVGGVPSHHWVDMSGVAVDGDQVVHRRVGAGRRDVGSHEHVLLAAVIYDGEVGEASRASRRA